MLKLTSCPGLNAEGAGCGLDPVQSSSAEHGVAAAAVVALTIGVHRMPHAGAAQCVLCQDCGSGMEHSKGGDGSGMEADKLLQY